MIACHLCLLKLIIFRFTLIFLGCVLLFLFSNKKLFRRYSAQSVVLPYGYLYEFHSNFLQIFERILYIWAIRHPASGYVQGINDLVTPFFVVFLSEFVSSGTFFGKSLPFYFGLSYAINCRWFTLKAKFFFRC